MKTATDLKRDVEEELACDWALEAASIGVSVSDLAVTLTGHVRTYAEKIAAEKAAKRVDGVIVVANDLEVRMPTDLPRDDTDIAGEIARALAANVNVPSTVTATVESGWVNLSGTVGTPFQRRATEMSVRDLIGVQGITNVIQIEGTPTAVDVKDRIRKAFHRRARLDTDHVTVSVVDGEATLSGSVRSWSDRLEAEHAAATAPGVSRVQNKLIIDTATPTVI